MTKTLSILGSTGSIGRQTLSLVEALGIRVTALTAHSNIALLEEQALLHRPQWVSVVSPEAAETLQRRLAHTGIRVLSGEEGSIRIAEEDPSDTLLNAVVGIAGLLPTLTAIESGKRIALANKETLVAGGQLVMEAAKKRGVSVIPVDSEHSAIFQALQGSADNEISRIFLTASGGPFFGLLTEDLRDVTVERALLHPTWTMGKKITIDSATMMNKGLELIEAMWLFDLPPDRIEVLIHRQSIVHSMVEFFDRAVLAQLSVPDMRIPIQYALTYPKRFPTETKPLTIDHMRELTFSSPDFLTFSCLSHCIAAAKMGGLAPAAVNAANEQAVSRFLNREIGFLEIGEIVGEALVHAAAKPRFSLEDVLETDRQARERAQAFPSSFERI